MRFWRALMMMGILSFALVNAPAWVMRNVCITPRIQLSGRSRCLTL